MKTLLDYLSLLCPGFWCMNHPYDKEWDAALNYLMRHHTFEHVSEYRAKLGGIEIWIENYPYGCMCPINQAGNNLPIRPSRLTILRAYAKYKQDTTKQDNDLKEWRATCQQIIQDNK